MSYRPTNRNLSGELDTPEEYPEIMSEPLSRSNETGKLNDDSGTRRFKAEPSNTAAKDSDQKVIPKYLQLGTLVLDRYQVLRPIKSGGMGAIYEVMDNRLQKKWALKEMIESFSNVNEQMEATKRFRREATLLASLDHPNLPRVIDYFEEHGKFYLVMDFIVGIDLNELARKYPDNKMPINVVLKIATDILSILKYLHNRPVPIIYRDIKPANIMIRTRDKSTILIDFGIARALTTDNDRAKTEVGTVGYAPPEQYTGNPVIASDLYALGATMHELLSGNPPRIPFKFAKLDQIVENMPSYLNRVIEKALALEVEDRWQTAAEMLDALQKKDEPKMMAISAIPSLKTQALKERKKQPRQIPLTIIEDLEAKENHTATQQPIESLSQKAHQMNLPPESPQQMKLSPDTPQQESLKTPVIGGNPLAQAEIASNRNIFTESSSSAKSNYGPNDFEPMPPAFSDTVRTTKNSSSLDTAQQMFAKESSNSTADSLRKLFVSPPEEKEPKEKFKSDSLSYISIAKLNPEEKAIMDKLSLYTHKFRESSDVMRSDSGYTDIAINPQRELFVSAERDGTVSMQDFTSFNRLWSVKSQVQGENLHISFSPDGQHIAFNISRNECSIRYSKSAMEIARYNLTDGEILKTIFFKYAPQVIIVYKNGEIISYNYTFRRVDRISENSFEEITHADMTADGERLIVAYRSGGIKVYDPFTKALLGVASTGSQIKALQIAPNDKVVASSDITGKITLWNIKNMNMIKQLQATAEMQSIVYAPDNPYIFSSSKDSIVVWDLMSTLNVELACNSTGADIMKFASYPSATHFMAVSNKNLYIWKHI